MRLTAFRRLTSLVVAVMIAAVILFLLLIVMQHRSALASPSTIRYVDGTNGSDTGDCTASPCQTINYALSQASGGDTIQVAASNYTESLTLDKPVNLIGAGAETTVIRAVSGQRVMTVTGETISNSTVISGFTFTGGNPENDVGGGLLVVTSTPTIRNNRIISNVSGAEGGGLYILNSAGLALTDNAISGNFAATGKRGGGLYFGNSPSATVSVNTIIGNVAWRGGGLYLRYSPGAMLSKNFIISNTAGFDFGMKHGGGLYAESSGNTMLVGNEFRGNYSWNAGGGLFLLASTNVELNRNRFTRNHGSVGGGLFLNKSNNAVLANNVVVDNSAHTGSGLFIVGSSARLLHTTIARNSGRESNGIHITNDPSYISSVTMTNTILVSHTVGITVAGGNTVTVNGVLWYNTPITVSRAATATATVQNQHEGDPAFVDLTAGDYHIGPGSVAIDAGVETGVKDDMDSDPRLGLPDLGADEYVRWAYLPLVLRTYGQ